jgi:hypothetical protein
MIFPYETACCNFQPVIIKRIKAESDEKKLCFSCRWPGNNPISTTFCNRSQGSSSTRPWTSMALPDGSVKTTSQERLGEIKWNKG